MGDSTGPLRALRRLELWMSYIRVFGLLFAVAAVTIRPSYPSAATRIAAWTVVAVFAVGTVVIRVALDRVRSQRARERLGMLAFAFDAAVIMGLVWVFAYEEPYVTWALLFLVPMEGALRARLRGAVAGAVAVAAFFLATTAHRADLLGVAFDVPTYVFVVGLSSLVAGVTGTMAENWYSQSLAFERQSLTLAEVDRLKDRFLAITSHEIRGPLAAIVAGVDTVRRRTDRLSRDQRDAMLDMVSQQANHLARLVDDLLVSAELQGRGIALHAEWASLQATIDGALEAAAGKRRDQILEVFVEPVSCDLDHARLGQIVRNLVENAYKYTPERTRIAVTARSAEDGVDVAVSDEGPGIPPDKRDVLFRAFERIEETAAGQEGVGLGLYVVSQLVAAMNGRIDLASSSHGTSFLIHVPCERTTLDRPQLGLVKGDAGAS